MQSCFSVWTCSTWTLLLLLPNRGATVLVAFWCILWLCQESKENQLTESFHTATLADIRQFDQRQGRGLSTKLALLYFSCFFSRCVKHCCHAICDTCHAHSFLFCSWEFQSVHQLFVSPGFSTQERYLEHLEKRREQLGYVSSCHGGMVGFRCFSKEFVPPSCHWQGEQQAERAEILDLDKLHWQGCSPTIAMLVTRWCVGTLTLNILWCPLFLREREEMRKQEVQRPSTKIELVRIFSSSPSLLFWCCTSPGFHVSWSSTWSHKI